MPPKYSVILPICHAGKFLHEALETLSKATSPHGGFELLVVGDSPDMKIAKDATVLTSRAIFIRHGGSRAAALNAACAAASGEIWVFADDDCVFPQDWLLRIERTLENHPEAAVVGGRDQLPKDAALFDASLDHALNSFAGTGGIRNDFSIRAGQYYPKLWNMIVRAEAAIRVSFGHDIFNPNLCVHEDVELVDRIIKSGGQVLYEPEIVVGHFRDTNFSSFFFRNLHMAQVCRAKGIHKRAHCAALCYFVAILLTAATAPFLSVSAWTFGVLSGSYATLLGVTGLAAAWRSRRPALGLTVPTLILSLHAARAIGFSTIPPRNAP